MRAIVFADMRKKMVPPVSRHALGCYISMARLALRIDPEDSLEDVAGKMWEQMYISGRKKEMYMYSIMSFQVAKTTMKFQKLRMADTALSYIGELDIKPKYGDIKVKDVKCFITNNRFGPRLTAFALCVFDKIGVDMNYLKAEWTKEEAQKMASHVKKLLEEFV